MKLLAYAIFFCEQENDKFLNDWIALTMDEAVSRARKCELSTYTLVRSIT